MQTLIIGDIHGNFKALQQVLNKSNYDPFTDRLICVGDYVDGYPDSYKVVDLLIKLHEISNEKNIYLLGNHDKWFLEILTESQQYIEYGDSDFIARRYSHMWNQGGEYTYYSYAHQIDPKPDYNKHLNFFKSLKLYYIEHNILFVHAGWNVTYNPDFLSVSVLNPDDLIWDRTLFSRAVQLQYLLNKGYDVSISKTKFGNYDKIFIGHTATDLKFEKKFPTLQVCNIINVDTGAGFDGKLTAYRLEDGSIFQSDMSTVLYPKHKSR